MMTRDDCIDQICDAVGVTLTSAEIAKITNIIDQHDLDLQRATIQGTTARVSDIVSECFSKARESQQSREKING